MKASDTGQCITTCSPFELKDYRNQTSGRPDQPPAQVTFDFELSVSDNPIPLGLTVKNPGTAKLSQLVPTAHLICDIINEAAIKNENNCGRNVTCRKGCSNCCGYLVPLSTAETSYLHDYIMTLPAKTRRPVIHSFMRAARKLAMNRMPVMSHSATNQTRLLEDLSQWYQKLNITCPFMSSGSCSIYRHRPLVCREHLATSPPKTCSPASPVQPATVALPVSTAEIMMNISNSLENTFGEAVILPLTMIWCSSNQNRIEKTYSAQLLAEKFTKAITAAAVVHT